MIEQLESILATLKNSLPSQAPLIISEAIDPSRALILRETCLYRITELTLSNRSNYNSYQGVLIKKI